MLKQLLMLAVILSAIGCTVESKINEQGPPIEAVTTQGNNTEIEGVYAFVSETTTISYPKNESNQRTSDEWTGYWFFQNGHFSKVLMKNERPEWTPEKFPADARGTGFDAAYGTYELKDNNLELDYIVTFYPGMAHQVETWSCSGASELLTISQKLAPSRESLAKGERVVVLRRIRK